MARLASFLIGLAARKSARPFERAAADPSEAQLNLLRRMMERNRDTEYGRQYGFAGVRSFEDYRKAVPLVDYNDISDRIDRITQGEKNILTAETPVLFAQTSGTTGKPKYIPVTSTCRAGGGMTTWLHFARKDHPKVLSGKVLIIVSPAIEGHTESGIPFGSTSGMLVKELPKGVQSAYSVPYDVYEVGDYEAKYYALLRFGLADNVTFLGTANPSSILMLAEMADRMSEQLIRDTRDGVLSSEANLTAGLRQAIESRLRKDPARAKALEKARSKRDGRLLPCDYWPNMALLGCWKGGTVSSYIQRFPEYYDPDGHGMVPIRDMGYLASEARMSIPVSDHGAGGVLTVNLNVFEFAAVKQVDDDPDGAERWQYLGAAGLEVGMEYYVFISTTGGLYRYDINDVIEVVDMWKKTPVVAFRRKGRGMTNITGEKLSVNQVIEALNRTAQALQVSPSHFRAEPDVSKSRYVFKVEFEGAFPKEKHVDFLRGLDNALSDLNIEYKAKRASKRLKPPRLEVMKKGWYERGKQGLVAEGKRLFQAKTIVLDAKQGYRPEPRETEAEAELQSA
ncbi:MAG TPA: GH3 auxin-responsive promoter family protein [Candidatus Hydrogenedentes bacterium]|nr:GH3 auxin-responsive promoter family protein [Candidatus Hydrogenedentota bacterium]HQH51436.1 GH3 auxin-responsive promoter family protein [Candidatus Hydrogenedentota bacterium]